MYDAESVDPEIFDAEFVGHEDSIGNCLRDRESYAFIGIRVNVRKCRLLMLISAPNIAEVAVMTSHLSVGLDKAWLRGIRAIDDSGREVCLLVFGTVFMVLALVNAFHRPRIVCIGFL